MYNRREEIWEKIVSELNELLSSELADGAVRKKLSTEPAGVRRGEKTNKKELSHDK